MQALLIFFDLTLAVLALIVAPLAGLRGSRRWLFLLAGLAAARLVTAVALAQTVVPRSELRKQLEADIMCTCGGCKAPMNNCPMGPSCHGLKEQREKLDKFLDAGMDREQIRAAFVKDHGGEDVLAMPIDRGFNKLAWALPYVAGLGGAAMVALVAFRWSRRRDDEGAASEAGTNNTGDANASAKNDALNTRLDDELRDLD